MSAAETLRLYASLQMKEEESENTTQEKESYMSEMMHALHEKDEQLAKLIADDKQCQGQLDLANANVEYYKQQLSVAEESGIAREENIVVLKNNIGLLNNRVQSLNRAIEDTKDELAEADEQEQALIEEKEARMAELESLQAHLVEMKASGEQFGKDAKEKENRISELESLLGQFKEDMERQVADVSRLENEKAESESKLGSLRAELARLENHKAESEVKFQSLQAEISSLQSEKSQLESKLESLQAALSESESSLKEALADLSTQSHTIDDLEDQIESTVKSLKERDVRLEELNTLSENLRTQLEMSAAEIQRLYAALQAKEEESSQTTQEKESYVSEMMHALRMKDEQLTKVLAEDKQRQGQLELANANVYYYKQQLSLAEESGVSREEDIMVLKNNIDLLNKQIQNFARSLQDTKGELAEASDRETVLVEEMEEKDEQLKKLNISFARMSEEAYVNASLMDKLQTELQLPGQSNEDVLAAVKQKDEMIQMLQEDHLEHQNKAEQYEVQIQRLVEQLHQYMNDLEKIRELVEDESSPGHGEVHLLIHDKLARCTAAIEEKNSQIQDIGAKLRDAQTDSERLRQSAASEPSEEIDSDAMKEKDQKIAELQAVISEMDAHVNSYISALESKEAELKACEKVLERFREVSSDKDNQISVLKDNLQAMSKQVKDNSNEIYALQARLQQSNTNLEGIMNTFQVRGGSIAELMDSAQQLNAQVVETTKEKEKLEANLDKAKKIIEVLKRKCLEKDRKVKEITASLEHSNSEMKELRKAQPASKDSIIPESIQVSESAIIPASAQVSASAPNLESDQSFDELTAKFSEMEIKLKTAEEMIESVKQEKETKVSFLAENMQEMEGQLEISMDEMQQLQAQLQDSENQIQELHKLSDDYNNKVKELESDLEKRDVEKMKYVALLKKMKQKIHNLQSVTDRSDVEKMLEQKMAENQQLEHTLSGLVGEKDQLQQTLNTLAAEKEHVQQMLASDSAENEQFQQTLTNLTTEKDHFKQMLTDLAAEKDHLQCALTDLGAEKEQVITNLKAEFQSAMDNSSSEVTKLQSELQNVTEELRRKDKSLSDSGLQVEALNEQVQMLKEQLVQLFEHQSEAAEEQQEIRSDLKEMRVLFSEKEEAIRILQGEIRRLSVIETSEGEIPLDKLKQKLSEREADLDVMSAELMRLKQTTTETVQTSAEVESDQDLQELKAELQESQKMIESLENDIGKKEITELKYVALIKKLKQQVMAEKKKSAAVPQSGDSREEVVKLTEKVTQMTRQCETVQAELVKSRDSLQSLQMKFDACEEEREKLVADVRKAEEQMSQLENVNKDFDCLKEEFGALQQQFKEKCRIATDLDLELSSAKEQVQLLKEQLVDVMNTQRDVETRGTEKDFIIEQLKKDLHMYQEQAEFSEADTRRV
jgi:chromosome segregation ATPase